MTEITNNAAAPRQQTAGQTSRREPARTVSDINRISGLASGLNTQSTIEQLVAVERKRIEPVQGRKNATRIELEAYKAVQKGLEGIRGVSDGLAGNTIWEGKIVESNNEKVVTATATAGAKPGKHTLVVDKLALNHQVASQGFAAQENNVGVGRMRITVGEGSPVTVVVDETNDTLIGLRDAINAATDQVEATVIKTGAKTKPYQLVLTSKKTGSEGRLKLEVGLNGAEAPSFENSIEPAAEWKGVGKPLEAARKPVTGTGASTAIVRALGEYAGAKDSTYTFTAVQTGVVGGENQLQLRWKNSAGKSGTLELDSFNYAPGEPIPVHEGINLLVSQGEIIVGDQFTVNARAQKSDLFWWLAPEQRSAAIALPSAWTRQAKFGAPVIDGPYTGEDERAFTLTVEGSGQIGSSADLAVRWEADDGETGTLRVGRGYEPGSKMALVDGITLALKPGVMRAGQTATFRVNPEVDTGKWWLKDEERRIPAEVLDVTNFSTPEEAVKEVAAQPEFPEELGPRISSTKVQVSGKYVGEEARVYTFTAQRDGAVGTTKDMKVRWEDDKGGSGEFSIGDDYPIGTNIPIDQGLLVGFGPGRVFKDDSFTVRTRTATIQPAQDARIRLGATELGGGLEITSAKNELDNVIDGVKLNLLATSDKPVTITIKGDTQKAVESVLSFGQQFNTFSMLVSELTKYDPQKNEAGPLLGNRDVGDIRERLTELMVDPVGGLPASKNMVFSLGMKLTDKGVLNVDEGTLRSKVDDDFGAVADLFRSRGESKSSAVAVVGLTEATQPSAAGLAVNITQVATQGYYASPALAGPILIGENNRRFAVTVDGKRSGELMLEPGVYGLPEYARVVQDRISNDEAVGRRGIRVVAEEGRIKVYSGRYGSQGSVAFGTVGDAVEAGVGLLDGASVPGKDVAGTIEGEPGVGSGQLLKGADDSRKIAGLRLLVTLKESQLNPDGPETTIRITKGVASRISSYMKELLDPQKGTLKRITDNLTAQVKDVDLQIKRLEEQIDRKRGRLQDKFARLEGQMQQLKQQQTQLQGQLAGLPRGGGAGLPGLPGL
ncbi:MAG: flagellar filament capping protein FliD [Candidatus Lambdaproteobacteria bacterium]|nr:flagellar filament capping protein FliD [Candidatus Lambdaproteobacteria bacterium]